MPHGPALALTPCQTESTTPTPCLASGLHPAEFANSATPACKEPPRRESAGPQAPLRPRTPPLLASRRAPRTSTSGSNPSSPSTLACGAPASAQRRRPPIPQSALPSPRPCTRIDAGAAVPPGRSSGHAPRPVQTAGRPSALPAPPAALHPAGIPAVGRPCGWLACLTPNSPNPALVTQGSVHEGQCTCTAPQQRERRRPAPHIRSSGSGVAACPKARGRAGRAANTRASARGGRRPAEVQTGAAEAQRSWSDRWRLAAWSQASGGAPRTRARASRLDACVPRLLAFLAFLAFLALAAAILVLLQIVDGRAQHV
jgi:hypothetical protein